MPDRLHSLLWLLQNVNAKGVMAVMSLGAKKGQEILIKVEGENEAEDAANLKAFVQEHL